MAAIRVLPDDDLLQRQDTQALLVRGSVDSLDELVIRLVRNGVAVRLFDSFVRPAAPVPPNPVIIQQQMRLQIPNTAPIAQGRYRLILRVNGSQAKNSPEVDIVG